MGPAATEGGVREGLGHGCCDAAGAIGDDKDHSIGIETPPYERAQEHSPGCGGLTERLAIVEQLPLPIGAYAIGGEHDPLGCVPVCSTHADPQAIEKQIAHGQPDTPPMEGCDLTIELRGQAADCRG